MRTFSGPILEILRTSIQWRWSKLYQRCQIIVQYIFQRKGCTLSTSQIYNTMYWAASRGWGLRELTHNDVLKLSRLTHCISTLQFSACSFLSGTFVQGPPAVIFDDHRQQCTMWLSPLKSCIKEIWQNYFLCSHFLDISLFQTEIFGDCQLCTFTFE